MKLNLQKDLTFLDLETTGLSVSKDRIVQLAMIKIFADGRPSEERCRLVNPGIPIPAEASAVHGITEDKIRNEPTFNRIARGIQTFIGDSDLATYNGNRFDIPLLMEEFERAGLPLDMTGRRTVDVQRIFHKMEPRTLSAAVRFYTGEKMEGAHDAGVDTRATVKVLLGQLEKYDGVDLEDKDGAIIKSPIRNDIQALHDFCTDPTEVDFQGKVKLNADGVAVLTFGKFQGMPVGESLHFDHKYYLWILNGDFTVDTKRVIERLVTEYATTVGRRLV
jgi:DNA polymerase-3 subunit epsilon